MPFNGSGVFQRVRNWAADATAGIKIRADYHDSEDDGFATGLSNCIARDGQSTISQNIPFNNKRITGLADPVNPQDAAVKKNIDAKVAKVGDTMTGPLILTGAGGSVLAAAEVHGTSFNLVPNPDSFFISQDATSLVLYGGAGNLYYGINFQNSTASTSWASIGPAGLLCAGNLRGTGRQNRRGTLGPDGSEVHNFSWTSPNLEGWINASFIGNLTLTSDYRIKKDVIDLPGMWDRVKALRPIQYTHANFNPPSYTAKEGEYLFQADDILRWGFIAHELQDTLLPSAATGEKDGEHPQSPDSFTVVAALTRALQEAMARIEALENRGA
jgi:hypothetical protein